MNAKDKLKITSVLPALSLLELLRMLANEAASQQSVAREAPRVTVYLNNGATFSGFVNGLKEDAEGGASVLFVEHEESGTRGQTISVVYLPIWSLVAVKVIDAEPQLSNLSGGKAKGLRSGPGIVGLRKKIADEVVRLRTVVQADIKLEVSWETLTQDDMTLLGLYELIDMVMNVIHEQISDEFKRIAFKTLVTSVRFQNASETDIILDENILVIRAELKEGESGRFSRQECEEALSALLGD